MKRFNASLSKSGSKVIITLPFDPNEAWGEKERHHITGTVNGIKIRGPVQSADGKFLLAPGPAWLRDSGLKAGDMVAVELAPEGPQLESLDEDIARALEAEPQAKAFFESLATFYRKGYLRWISGARQPEKRAGRIAEMVELLKAGKKQR